MSDDRDSPSHSGLRDRVSFFERVWSGRSRNDSVDATADVDEIERKIEQRKRHTESPKFDVKLKHTRDTQSPSRSFETPFPNLKLRHVEHEEAVKQRPVEEGDLGAGVRYVKFEHVTVKRTLAEGQADDRPDSPQSEWYSEYKHHTLHNAPRKDYVRSKSEYDSHIAEIRGK